MGLVVSPTLLLVLLDPSQRAFVPPTFLTIILLLAMLQLYLPPPLLLGAPAPLMPLTLPFTLIKVQSLVVVMLVLELLQVPLPFIRLLEPFLRVPSLILRGVLLTETVLVAMMTPLILLIPHLSLLPSAPLNFPPLTYEFLVLVFPHLSLVILILGPFLASLDLIVP